MQFEKGLTPPSVAVWKDGRFGVFSHDRPELHLNESLHGFVNTERFTRFMKVGDERAELVHAGG